VLSVPLIGNLIIILYDSHAKTKAENILKSIPAGTSLSDENIKALKQAIGYGSAAAMVRLAQFYLWHPDRNDMEVDTYERATSHLYKEAWKHGHKEAQEWSKWSFYLTPIIKLKQTMMVTSEFMRERAFKNALYQAEVWTPEMQKQLPTFEGICSFCFRYPTPQKMTLLRKLCDKVEKNHTCDTAQVREKIATFEKLSVDGTLVSLE
jgi:hypothetical protein